jgi:hypothetical protein
VLDLTHHCQPALKRRRLTSRHVANHPAVRWARRHRTHH